MADETQHQILLNAIKNKFSAQNNSSTSKPNLPTFVIPALATPTILFKKDANIQSTIPTQNVQIPFDKKFMLINKLENEDLQNKGQTGSDNGGKFIIPVLTQQLEQLQVTPRVGVQTKEPCLTTTTNIDLTTALTVQPVSYASKNTQNRKSKTKAEQFDIPFIECDRLRPKNIKLICQYKKPKKKCVTLKAPSRFGKLLVLTYSKKIIFSHNCCEFKVKHKIAPFRFDTKSPDDIVLNMLNKFHRRT